MRSCRATLSQCANVNRRTKAHRHRNHVNKAQNVASPLERRTAALPPATPLAPEPPVVSPSPSHPELCGAQTGIWVLLGPPPHWRPRLEIGTASSPPSSSGCARDGTPGTPDVRAAAGDTWGSHTIQPQVKNECQKNQIRTWIDPINKEDNVKQTYKCTDPCVVPLRLQLCYLLLSLQQLLPAEVQLFGQHCKLLQGHKRELLLTPWHWIHDRCIKLYVILL